MADATRRVSVRLSLDDAARVKSGLREVGETGQRSLERIREGAAGASRGLALLDTALRAAQVVAFAAGLRQVIQASDALTTSLFRLQNATGSVRAAADVYERLYQSSLRTGVAVAESADAFQRFAVAARAIGATNDQVARLVTGLQASALVSGASAQEIGSATLQLSQALASGTLQGDELRSVLEAMPLLAEALAAELGVGVGQLRRMGSEGQLTADRVFPALLRAAERLGSQLDNAPLTLSRAFGQLQVSTNSFLAQLDRAIGLSNTLARVLSGAARSLDATRRGAGLLADGEVLQAQRGQLSSLDAEIARLEAGASVGVPRRGSVRPRLAGVAAQQAGDDQGARLVALRDERLRLALEIEAGETEAAARGINEREQAQQRAADARRQRAEAEVASLRPRLDAEFRIRQEFEQRTRSLNEALGAGAIDTAERDRLAALALRERDQALQRLEGTTRRVASIPRPDREAEREINELIRDRERLIQNNETAYEKYQRRLESLGRLVERAERAGRPVPDETIGREANAALEELERGQQRVQTATARSTDVARELGLAFSSAFEDAIVKGESFSKVLQGIASDLLRIGTRKLVTEPLVAAASGFFKTATASDGFLGNNSFLGSLFSGGGLFGRLLAGVFHEGGLVGAGGPTRGLPMHAFLGAQRYHNGGVAGLRPDEVPAILQRGERVLSREQVRHGMGGGPSIVMNITTPDAASFRASQAQILAEMNRALARGRRGL